ncbi:MAG: PHP domain-containing protein [bacterium]
MGWGKTGRFGLVILGLSLLFVFGCTISLGMKKHKELKDWGGEPERARFYQAGEWKVARASLHNHTTWSDGCRKPEELLELARQQGMAILAITDHREGTICMGKGLCVETGGVENHGYDAYYERLEEIERQAEEEGMILLEGVEVIPWFYNMGKFPALVLRGLFQHFTVYGVSDAEVLQNMPIRRNFPDFKPEQIPDATHWQEFVDYVNENGGMVHAVHVESDQDEWLGAAHAVTPSPVRNLHRLRGLTAFSVLPAAWHQRTGAAGGLWDTVLLEYLTGMRDKPMWSVADADYHGPHGSLAIATTLFYMEEFTEKEVYRCMREGRMIALQGESFQDSYVSEWWVSGSENPAERVMLGEEVYIDGTPIVRFALDHPVDNTTVRLIRNGVVIAEEEGTEITYRDHELGEKREPAFYRIEVKGPVRKRKKGESYETRPESELFTNPVFVRFGTEHLAAR